MNGTTWRASLVVSLSCFRPVKEQTVPFEHGETVMLLKEDGQALYASIVALGDVIVLGPFAQKEESRIVVAAPGIVPKGR